MTTAEARARIEDETQWEAAPALSSAEVDRLVLRARVTDVNGVEPDGPSYVATYTTASINSVVAMGFRMKAAKVSGQFDVKAGDVEAKRSQQADMLSRRAGAVGGVGVITLTTALTEAV